MFKMEKAMYRSDLAIFEKSRLLSKLDFTMPHKCICSTLTWCIINESLIQELAIELGLP